MSGKFDAVVVGSGPNGLAAAIRLAQEGWSVLVVEGSETIGGGVRSAELMMPGHVHDVCSAVHPFAAASPFLRRLPLKEYGLEWIHPEFPVAHPLDDGTAVVLERDLGACAARFGADEGVYRRVLEPFTAQWESLMDDALQPLIQIPRRPLLMARFGLLALRSARGLAESLFETERLRALYAGMAAHSLVSFRASGSAAIGLMLWIAGHAVGWPIPRGGAQAISAALAAYLQSLGGEIVTGRPVRSLREFPEARTILLDVTCRQLLRIAGERLPAAYRRRLERYRFGPGVFKIDYVLDGPVPWRAAECLRAGTVHLGGVLAEVAEAEEAVWRGRHPERPIILAAQHTLFDTTRVPSDSGHHILWSYCHVPHGSTRDMTEPMERQIERFAPGFRDRVVARHLMNTADLERMNPNLIGGDINGGTADLYQIIARPVPWPWPYRTPIEGVYLCSASTPPGGGVHGMCGFHAAETALRDTHRPRSRFSKFTRSGGSLSADAE